MDPSANADAHNILALIEQLQLNADEQNEKLAQLKNAVLTQWSQSGWTPQQIVLLEQPKAPTDALRSVLQRLYQCTVMSVPPEPPDGNSPYADGWWSGTSVHEDTPADHQSRRREHIRVVDLGMYWIPTGLERHNEQRGCIVIQRVISYGAGEISHAHGGDHLQDAFDDYVAKKLVDPTWNRYTQAWVTPVCENMASAAEKLSGFHEQYHNLVLGEPVQSIAGLLSPDSAPVDVVAGIAAELPLPGDTLIKSAKRMLQFAGIFIGAASGQPLLVNACVKSLLKDYLVDAVRDVIGNALTQAGGRELPAIGPKPTNPQVKRSTPPPPNLPPDEPDLGGPAIFRAPPGRPSKPQTFEHPGLQPRGPQVDRQRTPQPDGPNRRGEMSWMSPFDPPHQGVQPR